MEQNTPEEPEPELDMAEAERVGHMIPSQEHMDERLEYFRELDDTTLIKAWYAGFEEGDIYSIMDSAVIGPILTVNRGYETSGGEVLKDGEPVRP